MQNRLNKIVLIVIAIVLSACTTSTPPAVSQLTLTPQLSSTQTPIPTPTDDLATQKQKIVEEATRMIAEFNQLVEQEKLLGNVETQLDSETGKEYFFFKGESDTKIRAAFKQLIDQLSMLREEYTVLYKQEYNPTPFPTFATKDEARDFYYQILQEDQTWLENQKEAGTLLDVYDPDRGGDLDMLSFEQDAWLGVRYDALTEFRLQVELSPDILAKHKEIVQKLDGESMETGEVTSMPFYRSDITLFQYQTRKNYYTLNEESTVIQVVPVQMPLVDQLTPVAPLNEKQLEERALSFINLFSPGTDVNALTPAGGSKIGSFFYRWEDRTKPLLDDGRSYPFIQVGLNQDGELLNYYNTLPLSY